ncbi:MAG: hypothetical protein G8237_08115 [Magnetococcales bacterium]|nr:hypothetical protein [Magnetococcales bacterium]
MVTIHINGSQFQFATLEEAELEAITHLLSLHTQVMEARVHARRLEGVLAAMPYRNRDEDKAAHLREAVQLWHHIRRAATCSRKLDGIPNRLSNPNCDPARLEKPWNRLWHPLRYADIPNSRPGA